MKSTPSRKGAAASPSLFHGAPARAIPLLQSARRALDANDVVTAERILPLALLAAPGNPHVLNLLGRSQLMRGYWKDAAATFLEAVQADAGNAASWVGLGKAQSALGEATTAKESLQRAVDLSPSPANLLELGIVLDAHADAEGALQVADRLLSMDSALSRARLLRARCLQALGRIDDTAAEYRELLRRRQEVPAAWFALLDIKTVRLDDDEFLALRRDAADPRFNPTERSLLSFALGQACETAMRYPEAVAAFDEGNRLVRQRIAWSADDWSREVDRLLDVFGVDANVQGDRGSEVIFIVGLPRSGTTLIEQVLGAHSQVEGANELPDLITIIEAEGARRRLPFADWAARATGDDWARLGDQYLERTRRWRQTARIHTDKMPENWPYVGAIRKMLPGARVIDSRRDPLETGWSCYKQLFAPQRVRYSYDARELGQYWRDYDRFMNAMAKLHPQATRQQSHAALVADFPAEVAELLEFCGLAMEDACLSPHRSSRNVRTASAAQVRQPVSAVAARSGLYGAAMKPFADAFRGANAD